MLLHNNQSIVKKSAEKEILFRLPNDVCIYIYILLLYTAFIYTLNLLRDPNSLSKLRPMGMMKKSSVKTAPNGSTSADELQMGVLG